MEEKWTKNGLSFIRFFKVLPNSDFRTCTVTHTPLVSQLGNIPRRCAFPPLAWHRICVKWLASAPMQVRPFLRTCAPIHLCAPTLRTCSFAVAPKYFASAVAGQLLFFSPAAYGSHLQLSNAQVRFSQ